MSQPDVALIHPPSVYDFRKRTIFYGPVSDVIPSSPVFEMYPVGFLSLATHLRRHGHRVRIVNLALKMMRSRRFDAERALAGLRPQLFGIDLHWLPHAHGAIEVSRLLKRLHPEIPIVFGGISATYFHEELITEPSVDFVLRGSVTEPNLLALVEELIGDRRFERVPGLTWCAADGPCHNPFGPAPASLDPYDIDLEMLVGDVVGQLDFWSSIPFHGWWRHPITAVFTVRGCARDCITCGAAKEAFGRYMPHPHPLLRSPRAIAAQVRALARITRAPVFLVGDIQDGGPEYAAATVDAIGATGVTNQIIFEFFEPPSEELIHRIDERVTRWGAELSPESHDPNVRDCLGKAHYTNGEMEASVSAFLETSCERLDLFFMIGLPEQTKTGVLDGVDYIEELFRRFDRRLSAFITPMGPFLDPGSDGFEQAERRGYRLFARTLAEHRALLEEHDWERILNYETAWMTRAEIVEATYDAAERLNTLKRETGRIAQKTAKAVAERLAAARDLRRRLAESAHGAHDPEIARVLEGEIRAFSEATINDKAELFPPRAFLRNFHLVTILGIVLRRFWARVGVMLVSLVSIVHGTTR
jgi:B12-binding domain/radical SAM domain protein